jgi:hypothetical protein
VFSLVLSAISISTLINALRKNPEFKELKKNQGWHGYIKEDGSRVEVFVKRDEKQIQFNLPDLSVSEETCKKAVKKLTAKLYASIDEQPIEINIVGPTRNFCHYCLEPAKELLFKCKRCGEFYCHNHRLPEEHDCPGGESKGIRVKQLRKRKERKIEKKEVTKKIILKEIPCG